MNKHLKLEEVIKAEKINNEAFLKNTDKPSLERLAHVLRHKELWPKGFWWNFTDCNTCAMGLAHKMWRFKGIDGPFPHNMIMPLYISLEDAHTIFHSIGPYYKYGIGTFGEVTPEMVASEIENYIAKHKKG